MELRGRDLGKAAAEWAERGIPVFPCAKTKKPLTKRGFLDATTNPEGAIELFASFGDDAFYIGAALGEATGLFAVDFDTYKEGGAEFKEVLLRSGALTPTRVHKTVNGGEHWIYYAPEGVAVPRNSKLHPSCDIRGEGGYIILPPSTGYEVVNEFTSEATDKLLRRIKRKLDSDSARTIPDLERAILSADDFHGSLASLAAKMSVRGDDPVHVFEHVLNLLGSSVARNPQHDRHDRWSSLMKDKGKEVVRLINSAEQKFNDRAGDRDLAAALYERNMNKKRGASGSHGEAAGGGSESKGAETAEDEEQAEDGKSGFSSDAQGFPFPRSYAATEAGERSTAPFLLWPLIHEGDVLVLSAQPKAGKTLLTTTLALNMAAGLSMGDGRLVPLDREGREACLPVIYFALEGQGAIRKRVKAWLAVENEKRTEFGHPPFMLDDLHLYIVELPLNLVDATVRQKLVDDLVLADIYFQSRGWAGVKLVVFDTLTKTMPGADQNTVEATSAVFDTIDMMKDNELNPAVLFVHHDKKDGGAPRGSGNILAEPDTVLNAKQVEPRSFDGERKEILELSVYMAREIDDTLTFQFRLDQVKLGVNAQNIIEYAPVLTMLSGQEAYKSVEEQALSEGADEGKRSFYQWLMKELSASGKTATPVLHRKANSLAPTRARKFYKTFGVQLERSGIKQLWAELCADEVNPLSGVKFVCDGDHVDLHIGNIVPDLPISVASG